ncbi:MAG TPA: hypothetical protein VGP26_28565 [Actinophytocola sp.]|nr:hypothetical protein [Actinophytocola sp.]
MVTLGGAVRELSRRLAALFLPGQDGRRPVDGKRIAALGATHQTGWTALVAVLLFRMAGPEPDMVTRP